MCVRVCVCWEKGGGDFAVAIMFVTRKIKYKMHIFCFEQMMNIFFLNIIGATIYIVCVGFAKNDWHTNKNSKRENKLFSNGIMNPKTAILSSGYEIFFDFVWHHGQGFMSLEYKLGSCTRYDQKNGVGIVNFSASIWEETQFNRRSFLRYPYKICTKRH